MHSTHLSSERMWSRCNKSPNKSGYIGFSALHSVLTPIILLFSPTFPFFCCSAKNFMNVQFTFSSRSLTKLLRIFTPGSPSSAPLPLGSSRSWFPTRPDTNPFLSHVLCHGSTKVLKSFHVVSDGNASLLLPTSSLNVYFIFTNCLDPGRHSLFLFFISPVGRNVKSKQNKIQMTGWRSERHPFRTTPSSCPPSACCLQFPMMLTTLYCVSLAAPGPALLHRRGLETCTSLLVPLSSSAIASRGPPSKPWQSNLPNVPQSQHLALAPLPLPVLIHCR